MELIVAAIILVIASILAWTRWLHPIWCVWAQGKEGHYYSSRTQTGRGAL
jgi:hypothetical protein